MKVCHLTSVHIPFDTRIFYKECRSLADAGYEVHLIAPHDRNETVDGIHIHAVPKRSNKLKRMVFTTAAVLKKALSLDAVLYHFHDPELIPCGVVLRLSGRNVVYDIHEDYPEIIPRKKNIPYIIRMFAAMMTELLERLSAHYFSAVVTVTPNIYERFRHSARRRCAIHNYPVIREHDSVPWDSRADEVFYIGSIAHNRGIVEMVKAIGLVQKRMRVRLVLAGEFTTEALEREIRALPEFMYVDYRSFVNRNEAGRLMSRVRVGLIVLHPEPRYKVSYPNKLFEYMAAGIPVIASDFPLWRQIIEESRCGFLVEPLNPAALAEAIIAVLQKPGEAEAMGKHGREAAVKKFRWENEKKKLLDLYADILS